MHRHREIRPTQQRIIESILVCTLIVLGPGTLRTVIADETGRFPPQPWGLDSPAGQCVVCHSLERGGPFRVAPNLWGIVGSPKARDKSWYVYSPALLEAEGVWTEEELDRYLEDANSYLPGTTKSIVVRDPEVRQKIIDFLKDLSK